MNVLSDIANKNNVSIMQATLVAYRYDSKVAVSLVGFSKEDQIQEAISSLDIKLITEDLAKIDEASLKFKL